MNSTLLSFFYVLAAALLSASILVRLRQPNLIGYLIAGMLIGPHGLGLVPYENVGLLSEIGIGLLMFTIGVELSVPQLMRVKYVAILGGGFIVLITVLVSFIFAPLFHWDKPEALLWGLTAGLSSTVVVLKILAEKGEVGSTHGNVTTGILLFQDIISIPILVFIPVIATGSSFDGSTLLYLVGTLLGFLFLTYVLGRFIIPRLLRFVANTHSKELFSIAVLCLTLAVAAITHSVGLSLALGAFVAGLIISESDFGNQAASEVLPLKDSFSAVFFVSVGMLLNFSYFIEKWPIFTIGLASLITLKFFTILIVCFLFRYPAKISVYVAMALAQIGEFGFLILVEAKKFHIIEESSYQKILGISILSIVATPYFLKLYPQILKRFTFLNSLTWIARSKRKETQKEEEKNLEQSSFNGHVIVCGYGPTGSIVAKRIQNLGMQVIVVDLNYKVIQSLKSSKQFAIYGDSSSMIVLEGAGIEHASLLIVTIPDPTAMRALIKKVKKQFPDLPVIMRVKYMSDRDQLLSLGADEIVWEEYEAGQEITRRAMARLNLSEP